MAADQLGGGRGIVMNNMIFMKSNGPSTRFSFFVWFLSEASPSGRKEIGREGTTDTLGEVLMWEMMICL